jgi:hypothetical protein
VNTPVAIAVSGQTEGPRLLYVFAELFGCSFSSGEGVIANGEQLSGGSFKRTYSFTPTQTHQYRICAFLDSDGAHPPNAQGSAEFFNTTPEWLAQMNRFAEEIAEIARRERSAREHPVAQVVATESKSNSGAQPAQSVLDSSSIGLTVSPKAHAGRTSKHPGYTGLQVTTAPGATVTIELIHHGVRSTQHFKWGTAPTGIAETFSWSCKTAGITYTYLVTAQAGPGAVASAHGRFTLGSVSRCRALKHREANASGRGGRQVEREENALRKRLESSCSAAHGRLYTSHANGASRILCRAPDRTFLPVSP